MCAVPVILDRIYKGINKKIDEGGEFKYVYYSLSVLLLYFIKLIYYICTYLKN